MDYLLIISGAARNVGKTMLACRLIEKYKEHLSLTAVKTSPHFHDLTPFQKVVIHEEGLIISEEQDRNSSKDSSRYLQAGAVQAIYIQSTEEKIPLAYCWMTENLKGLVICESASLGNLVTPDQAVFVRSNIGKKQPVWSYSFQTTLLSGGNFIPEIWIPAYCLNTISP